MLICERLSPAIAERKPDNDSRHQSTDGQSQAASSLAGNEKRTTGHAEEQTSHRAVQRRKDSQCGRNTQASRKEGQQRTKAQGQTKRERGPSGHEIPGKADRPNNRAGDRSLNRGALQQRRERTTLAT